MRRGPKLRILRRLARAGLWDRNRTRVGLWYHPQYDPPGMADAFQLTGLLPTRNQLLLAKLLERGVIRRHHVHASPIAAFEDLSLVHPPEYIESVARPEALERIYGYPVLPEQGDLLLLSQRRGVGGTVAATEAVLAGTVQVGINVGGGFHHAEANKGSGYCVFNDVAIAIAKLRKKGYLKPVAIVDLDFHQGNGNLRIFARDRSVLTYSVHGAVWDPDAGDSDFEKLLPPGASDEAYLDALRTTLPQALKKHRPGFIFYIAGNDVLAGDRLGTFALTPAGVLERDSLVYQCAREIGASLVVTLGGGYSPLAWQCTANFISYIRKGRARARTNWEPDLRSQFSEIAETLEKEALQEDAGNPAENLTEAELLGDLGRLSRPRQFLDYYSAQAIEFAFEKYGILKKIRKQGYTDIRLVTEMTDPERQILRITAEPDKTLLLELVVSRVTIPPPAWWEPKGEVALDFQFLNVAWLLLQHPNAEFGQHRPQLPGQSRPGLGIAEDVMELLVQSCRRTSLDGILSIPSHYHGASVASRWAHFLKPEDEGKLLAMRHVLFRFHLWAASEMVQGGGLRFSDGTKLLWEPSYQIVPVSREMTAFFDSSEYRSRALAESQRLLKAGLHVTAEALARGRPC